MFEKEILGNSLLTWCISFLFILGAVIIVKLLTLFNKKVFKSFISRTSNHLDDIIFYSIEPPIKFAILLLGIWIAIHKLVYPTIS